MDVMKQQILSILVENNPGVLSHVSGLFSRRGYNIDSISTGPTMDPRYTRMTIVTSGDEQILEQIEKQVAKLEDVKHIAILDNEESVRRELMLVKVKKIRPKESKSPYTLAELTANFHGKSVDETPDSVLIEVTGNTNKLDSFLKNLQVDYEILELSRTGLTALSRGMKDVITLD